MQRFINIDVSDALNELKSGRKVGHWIWYIFPQLKGLGTSFSSYFYGLKDLSEAKQFLNTPVLRDRLYQCCELLLSHDKPILQIMGSEIDCVKLRSSMTLFYLASETTENIFANVINKFFFGEFDDLTINLIKGDD